MLEGLEVSEVLFSEAYAGSESSRIDPEYFSKLARKALAALEGGRQLGSLVADGYRVVYESTDIIKREDGIAQGLPFFLQSSSITTPFINEETMDCVGMEDWERYEKGRIVPGELLIEVKGKAEKVAIVPEDFPRNTLVTGTCYKMTLTDPLDKYLLVSFLTCKYGQALKDRLKTNLLISYVAKGDLYSIPIPVLSQQTKLLIADRYRDAEHKHQASRNGYAQAETLLLDALGLANWHPATPLAYEQPASAAFASGRLDAEYYQPKNEALLAHLRARGAFRLGDRLASPIQRGISPDYVEEDGDLTVINSKHVGRAQVELHDNRQTTLARHPERKGRVRKYDVLLNSTGRDTIGRCQCVLEDVTGVVDNHVAIIRPVKGVDPVYLACFLNAAPGQQQTEQYWTGSSGQIELSIESVEKFVIWDAPAALQLQIRKTIEAAHTARHQAKRLLEAAKRAVEVAIEEGEAAALAYLETV